MSGNSSKTPISIESERWDTYDLSRLIFGDGIDPCFPSFSLESLLDRIEKNYHLDRKNLQINAKSGCYDV